MQPDDEVCLCFHVTKRKILNFLRVEKPRRAGQLSECFGAGTGCGWCRAYLTRLFQEAGGRPTREDTSGRAAPPVPAGGPAEADPAPDEYARQRAAYVRSGGGTPPPGATPIEPSK